MSLHDCAHRFDVVFFNEIRNLRKDEIYFELPILLKRKNINSILYYFEENECASEIKVWIQYL